MSKYRYLDNLIYSYFNQDSDLDGDTMDDLVNAFRSSSSEQEKKSLIKDIQDFQSDNTDMMEQVFSEKYGFDVDPALWGHTAQSFLEELLRLLK